MLSRDGYTLARAERSLPAVTQVPLWFQILGRAGDSVTEYETEHDKDLHLIAVGRDLSSFQHVHPDLDPEGTSSVSFGLSAPGECRVLAEFTPAGYDDGLLVGADLAVPGMYEPLALPDPTGIAQVVGGYQVALDGDLVPGQTSELNLTVNKGGVPVTDLQPYLADYGHLVALRAEDLAYLRVHPAGEPGDGVARAGPGIIFYATAPSAGATGRSWTSNTPGWSAPPSSPCTPGKPSVLQRLRSRTRPPSSRPPLPSLTPGTTQRGPTVMGTDPIEMVPPGGSQPPSVPSMS